MFLTSRDNYLLENYYSSKSRVHFYDNYYTEYIFLWKFCLLKGSRESLSADSIYDERSCTQQKGTKGNIDICGYLEHGYVNTGILRQIAAQDAINQVSLDR